MKKILLYGMTSVALAIAGCGTNSTSGVTSTELTPERIAAMEAADKAAHDAEAAHNASQGQ